MRLRATSGLFHELRLFTVSLPLDHPAVSAAVIDEADDDFVLVMEDVVARGADPRGGTRPLTIEQVERGPAMLGAGDLWQRPDIAFALAERYSAAYADLETCAALDAFDG